MIMILTYVYSGVGATSIPCETEFIYGMIHYHLQLSNQQPILSLGQLSQLSAKYFSTCIFRYALHKSNTASDMFIANDTRSDEVNKILCFNVLPRWDNIRSWVLCSISTSNYLSLRTELERKATLTLVHQ